MVPYEMVTNLNMLCLRMLQDSWLG